MIISLIAQNAFHFYDYCQLIFSFLIGLFYALVFFEVYFLIVLMVLIFSQVAIFNFQTLNKQLSSCIKAQIASCSKQGKTVQQPKLPLPLQLARFWALHQRTTACVLHFGRQVASPNIFVFFLTNFRFHVFLVVTIFFRSVPTAILAVIVPFFGAQVAPFFVCGIPLARVNRSIGSAGGLLYQVQSCCCLLSNGGSSRQRLKNAVYYEIVHSSKKGVLSIRVGTFGCISRAGFCEVSFF